MSKKIAVVEVYNFYGKSSGEELYEKFEIVDNKEERASLISDYVWSSFVSEQDTEQFINGETNSFYFDFDGGDWDEPTGRELVLIDKERADFIENFNKEKELELQKLLEIKFG